MSLNDSNLRVCKPPTSTLNRCVPVQIMSNQFGNRMHLSSISSLIEKGLNSSVNKVSVFYFE